MSAAVKIAIHEIFFLCISFASCIYIYLLAAFFFVYLFVYTCAMSESEVVYGFIA